MFLYLKEYIDFSDIDVDETYDSPLTNKRFVMFLKDYGIHDKFIRNTKQDSKQWNIKAFCDRVQPQFYITNAFFWLATPEGYDFWDRYDHLWLKYRTDH